MTGSTTLYRFKVDVSDIDRDFYEEIDFRAAMHPSETEIYLLTRVIAFCLNYEPGLEFTQGLCNPDEPAIQVLGGNGPVAKWIDIGNPSARRLHRASKSSQLVRVYTYKDPENLKREAKGEKIYHAERIEIFALSEAFLESLSTALGRDNRWTLFHEAGELIIGAGEESFTGMIERHRFDTD